MTGNADVMLIRILIGTAWMDGKMQPEEREYLQQVAREKGVADNPELQPLLHEFVAVSPAECYRWIQEYLGDRPTSAECRQLIQAIAALIFKDGNVASEESKLLANLQLLDSMASLPEERQDAVLSTIHKLYTQWIDEKNNSS